MATDKEAVRTIRSATDEAAETANTTVRSATSTAGAAANLAHEAADRGTETAKRIADQSSREFGRLINISAEASQDAARQFNQNLDVLLQVGAVVASGYQSILSEWSNFAQQAAQRNADAVNAVLRVRNPHDLLSVQGDLLKDGVQNLLSTSARISELSAEAANKAVEKLNARTQGAADD